MQPAFTAVDKITEPTNTVPNDSRFIITDPPAFRLSTVFPPLLAEAIKKQHLRSGWSAAITMSFLDYLRYDKRLGSMMSLEVMSDKADYLAWPLFGTHIASVNEHRYLVMPTGIKIMVSAEATLRGCRREAILEVFGEEIDKAVKASPAYKQEAEQGNPLTECVTMIVSNRASDGAVINLILEETWGVKLKDDLYGKQPSF